MPQTALARRNSAGWTGDGGELFRGQIAHPHREKMPENKGKGCSKWHSSKLGLGNGRSYRLTAGNQCGGGGGDGLLSSGQSPVGWTNSSPTEKESSGRGLQ